ncbi:PP2C family protein-serine/threonine phosphatase [Haliangium ochraceum]|uniref:Protein serine/threonine phosphatase n=1 Tax=Haliangium ochraceum (strain DSM 14365 / JCM 11303 / SMP-2) TaxID=502025 RepID=D0LIK4_HALO1|nr:protein phosphatase 2C domain-containing protein [Haliangium ochraceum]ACY18360.1 protein serine/threonine phosphatase [Haliangium ochraceum DSM 14365]
MITVSVGLSDVGRKRTVNEDALHRDDSMGFYVVADGVGGRSKGEIASRETVEQLRMWMRDSAPELEKWVSACERGDRDAIWEVRRLLENGVQSACWMVFGMAQLDPEMRGMSTTCSALLIRGGYAFAAHVGDSRVYRLRDRDNERTVLQLTEDHTLINYKLKHGLLTPEEAAQAPGKNLITRAVGHKDYVQVDTADIDVRPGDRFLLCSDGLHRYLPEDGEVADLIGADSIQTSAHAAIALANQRGGKDNITAVVVEVR